VARSQVWLTVLEDHHPRRWPPRVTDLRVAITSSKTLHGCKYPPLFLTSPIFPLRPDSKLPDIRNALLYFYSFDPAFPVLGRLVRRAPKEVQDRLFFTIGLASIVLVSNDRKIASAVEQIAGVAPRTKEIWKIKNSRISSIKVHSPARVLEPIGVDMGPYDVLPLAARSILAKLAGK
jgi:hypothetical protein